MEYKNKNYPKEEFDEAFKFVWKCLKIYSQRSKRKIKKFRINQEGYVMIKHKIRNKHGKVIDVEIERTLAIKLMCTQCMGLDTHPEKCESKYCPLFPFRGKSMIPMYDDYEKKKKEMSDRLKERISIGDFGKRQPVISRIIKKRYSGMGKDFESLKS